MKWILRALFRVVPKCTGCKHFYKDLCIRKALPAFDPETGEPDYIDSVRCINERIRRVVDGGCGRFAIHYSGR